MRKLFCLICLLPGIVGPSHAADEQDPETIADVRCPAVGLRISQLPDSSQKSAGLLATLYYLSRLDGRTPKLHLEASLSRDIESMDGDAVRAEAVCCGNSLTARGQQLIEIGEHLRKRGQAMNGLPTPAN